MKLDEMKRNNPILDEPLFGKMAAILLAIVVARVYCRVACAAEEDDGVTIAPAMMPQQEIWLSEVSGQPFHRHLLGCEAMQLQGWPVLHPAWSHVMQKYNDKQLQDLAGNAFPLTIIEGLITAVTFAASSHQTEDSPTAEDAHVGAALALRGKK